MKLGELFSKLNPRKEKTDNFWDLIKSIPGVEGIKYGGVFREIHGFPVDAEQLSKNLQKAGFKETSRLYRKELEARYRGIGEWDSDIIHLRNEVLGIHVSIDYDSEDNNVIKKYVITKGNGFGNNGEWKLTLENLSSESFPDRGNVKRLIRYKVERVYMRGNQMQAKHMPPYEKKK